MVKTAPTAALPGAGDTVAKVLLAVQRASRPSRSLGKERIVGISEKELRKIPRQLLEHLQVFPLRCVSSSSRAAVAVMCTWEPTNLARIEDANEALRDYLGQAKTNFFQPHGSLGTEEYFRLALEARYG